MSESEDPTRVLTPPRNNQQEQSISATRYRQQDANQEDPTQSFSPIQEQRARPSQVYSQTASSRPSGSERDVLGQVPPIHDDAGLAKVKRKVALARVQFLPGLLAWLATYSLLGLGNYLRSILDTLFPGSHYDSFQQAFAQLLNAGQVPTSLWIWLGISVALTGFAFGLGGYAAARMAGFAQVKQGLGLWFWHILAIMLCTIAGFALAPLQAGQIPALSLQNLLGANLLIYLPGLALELLLALLASLLGALCAKPYAKKVALALSSDGTE